MHVADDGVACLHFAGQEREEELCEAAGRDSLRKAVRVGGGQVHEADGGGLHRPDVEEVVHAVISDEYVRYVHWMAHTCG